VRRTLSVPLDFQEALRGCCLHGPLRRRLADLLALWDTNKENCDEGFWQIKLTEYALAVSHAATGSNATIMPA